jgi:diguanylate cyclase (GGDEF)-like protein/PAS domain S-box-containing protein
MEDFARRFAHLAAAEDASDDAVLGLDRDGLICSWNPAARRLVGRPLETVLARPLSTYFPDVDAFAGLLERVFDGERLEHVHLDLQRSPRLTIPVSATFVPLRQGEGPVVGCSVVVRDLTEQVFSQQTLAASEERVRRSEALAGIGRFVVDGQDGSTQWSEGMHAIHGTDPGAFEVSLSAHLDLVHPDDRASVADAFQSALSREARAELDHRVVRPDGRVYWVFLAVEPRHDSTGCPVGVSGICQDVTARTETETALHSTVAELTRTSRITELLREITVHANEAATVADAMRKTLSSVCAHTGWPVGHALVLSPERPGTLISLGVWHLSDPNRFSDFRRATEQVCHRIGEGLPGRTLQSGKPVWISDLSADSSLQTSHADACGLAAAFCLPIRVRADTVGVLEFFGSEVQEPDDTLLRAGSIFGGQLGQVIEREAAEKRLTQQALYDRLTGLPNRALLTERLQQSLERGQRNGTRVDVLYLDVDDFKVINDSRGHSTGDDVLSALSTRLREVIRAGDTIDRLVPSLLARLGGDEFAIILENCAAPEAVAERLRRLLKEPLRLADGEVFVSVSVGSALAVTATDASAETVLSAANLAMHEAKRAGKGQHVAFEPAMQLKARRRHELGDELHRAVENREFELHYQPVVALGDGAIHGAEALVRWRHPVRGMVPPNDFIERAEETGLILPIGNWVLHEACRQAASWQQDFNPDFAIAVNVSGRQLREQNFVTCVRDALARAQVAPETLLLEVTESILMEREYDAIAMLTELREDGVHLAIDDFGTGYSSLGALRRLPANMVKIDQSFVLNLPEEDEDASIVWTIVQLAHRLGMTVLAEGVETEGQRDALLGLGCDEAQGFLFSRPLSADAFTAELVARSRGHKPQKVTHEKRPARLRHARTPAATASLRTPPAPR